MPSDYILRRWWLSVRQGLVRTRRLSRYGSPELELQLAGSAGRASAVPAVAGASAPVERRMHTYKRWGQARRQSCRLFATVIFGMDSPLSSLRLNRNYLSG
jgi:hypothetical protein